MKKLVDVVWHFEEVEFAFERTERKHFCIPEYPGTGIRFMPIAVVFVIWVIGAVNDFHRADDSAGEQFIISRYKHTDPLKLTSHLAVVFFRHVDCLRRVNENTSALVGVSAAIFNGLQAADNHPSPRLSYA